MTAALATCDLTSSGSLEETVTEPDDMECGGSVLSALGGAGKRQQVSKAAATTTDTESGIFSGEGDLCVDHESELDWFCGTEQKVVCSYCTVVGSCQGHTVTPLADRVTAVRNHLVDVCEKIQLQALRIERFIDQTLTAKDQKLQIAANRKREQALAQISAAREALEEEEQRLLEEVHREEERVEQCLLTHRAHWSQALESLSQTRSRLVQMLTHAADAQMATSSKEIAERVEETEGVGEPCDTDKLNFNPKCGDSKLLRGLWAAAVLLGPNAYGSPNLKFDERTISPLLSLSDDLCTVTFLHRRPRQVLCYDPARFDYWPNVLGSLPMSSGTHSWVVDVGHSAVFKVGVCYASLERKGSGNDARLGYNSQSWVLSHYAGDYSFFHTGKKVPLQVVKRPQRIGLLLDWPTQMLLFYEADSGAVLYTLNHPFSAPLLPACAVTDCSVTIVH